MVFYIAASCFVIVIGIGSYMLNAHFKAEEVKKRDKKALSKRKMEAALREAMTLQRDIAKLVATLSAAGIAAVGAIAQNQAIGPVMASGVIAALACALMCCLAILNHQQGLLTIRAVGGSKSLEVRRGYDRLAVLFFGLAIGLLSIAASARLYDCPGMTCNTAIHMLRL
ncbi:hypothetical protein [Achromobacter insolitus]|uniref:hypothetical protein n=1 Tax=Achromobacter insolitus TaxID=217204 RepID=UPI0027E1DAA7|nr:hypothetical protein [Achromobacter insolitus]MDQ6212350.1 hypothetical protein [Achromobacter insolitus]